MSKRSAILQDSDRVSGKMFHINPLRPCLNGCEIDAPVRVVFHLSARFLGETDKTSIKSFYINDLMAGTISLLYRTLIEHNVLYSRF